MLVGAKMVPRQRRLGCGRRQQRLFGDPGRRFALGARPIPVSGQPADRRRQGWPRRQAGLRVTAGRRQELSAALPGHQHRLGHRARRAAQPRYRLPGVGRLLPGHPGGTPTAEHSAPCGPAPGPVPGRRIPGCATLRCTAVRTGWHAAVSRFAVGAAAGQSARTRSFAGGVGTVRAAGAVRAASNLRSPQPGVRAVATAALCASALTTESDTSSDEEGRHARELGRRHLALRHLRGRVPLGAFALFAVFAQLRFQPEKTYNAEFTNVSGLGGRQLRPHRRGRGRQGQTHFDPARPHRASSSSLPTTRWCSPRAPEPRSATTNLIGGRYLALEEGAGGVKTTQTGRDHPADPDRAGTGPRRIDRRLPAACSARWTQTRSTR